MEKHRLLALTDGVVAIIITIMVLELKMPAGSDFVALRTDWPVLLAYALSFVYVAIYWNNHHHYFHLVRRINGAVMWSNFHFLFWLSLVPFATAWMGNEHFAPLPVAVYGVALFLPAIAWSIMQRVVIRADGGQSASQLGTLLGRDIKDTVSLILYAAGIGLAFVAVWAALLRSGSGDVAGAGQADRADGGAARIGAARKRFRIVRRCLSHQLVVG